MDKRKSSSSGSPNNGIGSILSPINIVKRYAARARSFRVHNPIATNYAIDGLLVIGAMNLAVSNNNIFAQRLGAGDLHLTMLQFLPQSINLLILIPIGLFADSLRNKVRLVSGAMICSSFMFMVVAALAFIFNQPLYLFLIFMALGNAFLMVYNIGWLGFFPEVVEEHKRNMVLTLRSRVSVGISLIMPLISGSILAIIPTEEGKVIAHQVFYIMVALMLLLNAFHLRKLKAIQPASPKKIQLAEIKKAAVRLRKNKPFILFTSVALFFHITWHMDWTLYFIGQANYLYMNEFQLSLTAVGTTLAQLITLRFWSKRNQKYGAEKPLTFGILGLAFCPVAMLVSTMLPSGLGIIVFLVMHTCAMLFFATIGLNFFQCLFPVLDEEYRTLSVSVYTCLITLSNAIMPVVGVAIYRALGGNIGALRATFVIAFVLRIIATVLWWLRIRYNKSQEIEQIV